MYIMINKQWFEKNKLKLDNPDEKDSYLIQTENINAELNELNNGELFLSERKGENVYVSLDYKPNTETIVALVEDSIDDIKGEALVKIIELMVKKLNKFKSLIESIRGL